MRRSSRGQERDSTRVNERIRLPRVRVVAPDGEQLGVMSSRDALAKARELGLDLIEVAPTAETPVCRIMDYGKFKYEKRKRESDAHKKQTRRELKSLRIRPRTDVHDFQTKVRLARKFLEDGDKVRMTCMFRGREMAHQNLGEAQLMKVVEALDEVGQLEMRPNMQGRTMSIVISPKASK